MSLEPSQSNPFGCFILLALIFFFGVFGFVAIEQESVGAPMLDTPAVPAQARPAAVKPITPVTLMSPLPDGAALLGVDSAVLEVRGPGQVVVQVSGTWPDGCDFPVEVNTIVTPELVNVIVYRVVPPDVFCTMMLQPYSGEIDISAAFASAGSAANPARVPVMVNGVTANPLTK